MIRSLLLALLAVTVPTATPELRDSPTAETVLRRTLDDTTEWSLSDLRQTLDGEPVDSGQVLGMEVVTVRSVELLDRTGEVAEGRAQRIERDVERADSTSDITVESPLGALDFTVDSESDLVGETVVFDWNAKDERYDRRLEDPSAADLSSLDVDAGLTRLLPRDEVAVGGRWTVAAEDFVAALCLGGDLGVLPGATPQIPGDGISGADLVAASCIHLGQPWDRTKGTVELVWTETVEVDGRSMARIEVAGEVELTRDLTDHLERALAGSGADSSSREDYEVEVDWEDLDVQGEIHWDLDRERFAEGQLEVSGEAVLTVAWQDPFGWIEIEAELSTESTLELRASQEEG